MSKPGKAVGSGLIVVDSIDTYKFFDYLVTPDELCHLIKAVDKTYGVMSVQIQTIHFKMDQINVHQFVKRFPSQFGAMTVMNLFGAQEEKKKNE